MRTTVAIMLALLWLAGCSREQAQPPPERPAIQFQRAAASQIAHGERLARILGCNGCHGPELTGEDWSAPDFIRLWTSNLTIAVPTYTDAQLAAAITRGVRPDGSELWEMPSHLFTQLTPADLGAVIAYLRSRPRAGADHPRPVLLADARSEIAAGTYRSSRAQATREGAQWPPDAGPTHALGRYLVRATCAECHGLDLRGGRPYPEAAARPDLRMVAAYPPDQFLRLLRTGVAAGDRNVGLMGEVARGRYRHFTDDELNAIYHYLRTVGAAAR
jgi:mono/diheme cytochrome c family protein